MTTWNLAVQPGDIVRRHRISPTAGLWIHLYNKDHGNDVYTMHFFDTGICTVVTYTAPFGPYLSPDIFTIL